MSNTKSHSQNNQSSVPLSESCPQQKTELFQTTKTTQEEQTTLEFIEQQEEEGFENIIDNLEQQMNPIRSSPPNTPPKLTKPHLASSPVDDMRSPMTNLLWSTNKKHLVKSLSSNNSQKTRLFELQQQNQVEDGSAVKTQSN